MKKENNYAFIDAQNLNLGVKELGCKMDWKRLRVYLKEVYNINIAYLFLGYIQSYASLYKFLERQGYRLCFKKIVETKAGVVKGNVDAQLVFKVMLEYNACDRAVIVSSDGDFDCLVEHLYTNKKLAAVLSPHTRLCSGLLKQVAKEKMRFLTDLKQKLAYNK